MQTFVIVDLKVVTIHTRLVEEVVQRVVQYGLVGRPLIFFVGGAGLLD